MIGDPKISILCPSYNHEKFISYFIQSVLDQSEQDFELIIVDDCSTDKNIEEIQKFTDPRIKLIKHSYNQGINAGLNDAFNAAKGRYFVFIASDDILEPNHLKFTSGCLDNNSNINVVYCSLSLIEDENQPIKKAKPLISQTKDKFKILAELFLDGNSLVSPGMVVRRSALAKIMPLDLSMLQHQDYQMHINLLLENEVYLTTEKLVKYRQIAGNKNISASTIFTSKRQDLEQSKLMDSFLQIDNLDLLKKIFGIKLQEFGNPTQETIPYFLGRMALSSKNTEKQNWGYRTIMSFIKTKENLDLLNKLYGFDFGQYIGLVRQFTMSDLEKKYKKYKKLFNIFLSISALLAAIAVKTLCQK